MKISNSIKIFTIGMAGLILTACDDVKPDDRYILGDSVVAERAVLLEDFTGQMCINCPQAHQVIKDLEEQYGSDKLIAVSIHCGSFGFSKSRTNFERGNIGLMTDEGNAILETYSISSFPMGCVDMGSPITYSLWATAVMEEISKPSPVTLSLDVDFTPSATDEHTGTINMKADILSGENLTANVQFWIIEDGIVAPQRDGNTTVTDYVHNDVFRAQVFNGVRGGIIQLAAGLPFEKTGSIETRWNNEEHWETKNLSVVAYVSDARGVLQVVKKPVIPVNESEE
ncbi:MAG: Omp28 family outer membrane lipoprotein [Bacteroides sp.]|nr:Omp28 family outer membrane lipoprotein [Bacteroides sp.]